MPSSSPLAVTTLRGGWKETETKVISINREDNNEAVMYFKLLIELSYCDSYIHDEDGDLLDREARVELAKVANEFEFGDCIEQCITSLCGEESTLAEQILFLEEQIPTALQGREVVLKYRERMTKAVVDGGLGPVCNFFDQGRVIISAGAVLEKSFYQWLPLKPHIRALSIETMSSLMMSDKLECSTESEAYYLLCAWLSQSSDVKRLYGGNGALFHAFSGMLRFQHMSLNFLACIVSCCPFALQSGQMASLLRSGLVLRDDGSKRVAVQNKTDVCFRDRGKGDGSWTFEAKILLEDVVKLEKGQNLLKVLGLAPALFYFLRFQYNGKNCLCPYTQFEMPFLQGKRLKGELSMMWNIAMQGSVCLGPYRTPTKDFYSSKAWGELDAFNGRSWEDVISEGSPFFTNGEMAVTIILKAKGQE